MQDLLFYGFSMLTLLFGVFVIASRNPVTSAMCLVLAIVSMAGLYVLQEAFFLGAIQILVYAGAVMVLFLFVIMLMDLKAEERQRIQVFYAISGGVSIAVILGIFASALGRAELAVSTNGLTTGTAVGDTISLGKLLFTRYLLPFEILSVLLLSAMVGVILLSKKNLR